MRTKTKTYLHSYNIFTFNKLEASDLWHIFAESWGLIQYKARTVSQNLDSGFLSSRLLLNVMCVFSRSAEDVEKIPSSLQQ